MSSTPSGNVLIIKPYILIECIRNVSNCASFNKICKSSSRKQSDVLVFSIQVIVSAQDEYKMEFSIMSVQRSLILQGSTLEEREDWVTALNAAIEENAMKRNTFETVRSQVGSLMFSVFLVVFLCSMIHEYKC